MNYPSKSPWMQNLCLYQGSVVEVVHFACVLARSVNLIFFFCKKVFLAILASAVTGGASAEMQVMQ